MGAKLGDKGCWNSESAIMYLMMTKDRHVLNMPSSPLRPLTSIMSNYTIIQPPSNPPVFHRGTSALVHVCQRTAAEIECAVISIKAMVLIVFALVLSLFHHILSPAGREETGMDRYHS